jgi:hypothetical protein
MKIREIELSDFSLVKVRTTNECNPTPHCNKHGAMNKISMHEDGGGIWRCISVPAIGRVKVKQSNGSFAWGNVEHDSVCRAGCEEFKGQAQECFEHRKSL